MFWISEYIPEWYEIGTTWRRESSSNTFPDNLSTKKAVLYSEVPLYHSFQKRSPFYLHHDYIFKVFESQRAFSIYEFGFDAFSVCSFSPIKGPPSVCRNLKINPERTRANSVRIEWERPLITGRDDFYYDIYHSDPEQLGNFILHNPNPLVRTSPLVGYTVSGLRPLTDYLVRVTVENGVSEQDTGGEQGRSCEVSVTTGDIRKNTNHFIYLAMYT